MWLTHNILDSLRVIMVSASPLLPNWFLVLFFPLYFFLITFSAFAIIRGRLHWEDLGLNLHLAATNLVHSMMQLEHPVAQHLGVPMLLVIALPLLLTFTIYALFIRGQLGRGAKIACVGLGVSTFVTSLIWALSFFVLVQII